MMIGIFYGSSTGNTESLAKYIASKLDVAVSDIHDVSGASADKATSYDCLLLGSSTWGLGDLQDDWYGFIENLKKENLSGKKVGLFGCGDSASYSDTFCDAIGMIREELAGSGCTFIGEMDASDYPYTESKAFKGGKVLGLAADDDEPGKTDGRTEAWVTAIKSA